MRVSAEDGMTWYEDGGRKACVSRNAGGYTVTSFWDRDGIHWFGGYGAGAPVRLEYATDLAKRFVSGMPVPEELGGWGNTPEEVVK